MPSLLDQISGGFRIEERTPEDVATIKAARACGDCSLCCKLMSVRSIAKPANKWCPDCDPKSKTGGCRVYQDRPFECREFLCGWRLGVVPEHLKPNKVHAIFAQPEGGSNEALNLHMDMTRAENREVIEAAYAMSERVPIIIIRGNWRELISKRRVAVRNPATDEVWISSEHPLVHYADPIGREIDGTAQQKAGAD